MRKSLLELVLTNNDNMINEVQVDGQMYSSDHNAGRLKLELTASVPNFRRTDYET